MTELSSQTHSASTVPSKITLTMIVGCSVRATGGGWSEQADGEIGDGLVKP